ncbi:MAG: hypothetical protein Q8N63_04030 [Nanoarchaeota archaeon]|nr:hypothetical protein [Nanoarchaeota archaeon]
MFKQESNLRKCIKTLEEDLKDNQIHPSTIRDAIHSLENYSDMGKFFKSLKYFYKKMIKTELKKRINSTLTIGILERKESIESIAEDCAYRRIAENLPSHPADNATKESWVLKFPLLESYFKQEMAYRKDLEVGYLF